MDQIIDWVYSQVVGFLGDFFAQMGNMGVELFEMSWVQSIVLFFSYLAWTLYIVGLVVSAFETGIDYLNGRGSVKDALLNALKGFLAVSLFTTAPIELFKLSVELQASLTSGITGYGSGIDTLATQIIDKLNAAGTVSEAVSSGAFGGLGSITSPCHYKSLFQQPQAWRHSAHSDFRGRAVYVQRSPWVHGRFYSVVQTDHRPVSHNVFAGHYSCRRAHGHTRSLSVGARPYAGGRRSAAYLRCVRTRHQHPRQYYERCLHCAGGGQHHQNNHTDSRKIIKLEAI